jgi:hypothetical protein
MASEVIINKKKYVIIPIEKYESLTKKQVVKKYDGSLLSIDEARARTKARIEKWAKSA